MATERSCWRLGSMHSQAPPPRICLARQRRRLRARGAGHAAPCWRSASSVSPGQVQLLVATFAGRRDLGGSRGVKSRGVASGAAGGGRADLSPTPAVARRRRVLRRARKPTSPDVAGFEFKDLPEMQPCRGRIACTIESESPEAKGIAPAKAWWCARSPRFVCCCAISTAADTQGDRRDLGRGCDRVREGQRRVLLGARMAGPDRPQGNAAMEASISSCARNCHRPAQAERRHAYLKRERESAPRRAAQSAPTVAQGLG